MKRQLRPYSLGLFVLSIPGSYLLFVTAATLFLTATEQTFVDISDSIFVFSLAYGYSCYLWIPGFWLLFSIIGKALLKRQKCRDHSPS